MTTKEPNNADARARLAPAAFPDGKLALLVVLPVWVGIVIGVEVSRLPVVMFWGSATTVAEAIPEVTVLAARYLPGQLVFLGLLLAVHVWGLRRRRPRFWSFLVFPVLALIPTVHAYRTLVRYDAFAGYPPFVGLFFVFWIFLCLASATVNTRRPRRQWASLVHWMPTGVGIGGAIVILVLNYNLWRNIYPTMHLAMFQVAVTLLGIGLIHLWPRVAPLPRPRAWRWLGGIVIGALLASPLARAAGWSERLQPYVANYTTMGDADSMFHPPADDAPPEQPIEPDEDGEARLRAAFPLPEPPDDFELRRHNILLIVSEATRFDRTSLGNPELGTTPNLVRMRDMGSFSFDAAFAPSSVTLDSMSSLLTMKYPAACELETWDQLWKGHLLPGNVTVTERLAEVGYSTFWVGHDYRSAMSRTILGIEQGFESEKLFHDSAHDTESDRAFSTDQKIADAAMKAIDRSRREKGRPFFGLVFFVSPHRPYLARDPDAEPDSEQQYIQEIAYMDAQLGRLLDHLEKRRLLDDTILVFLSDHGEEFAEHGGHHHGRTLYVESVHVPFLLRIPGVEGHQVSQPVSTMHLFPWLFLHDRAELREAALAELRSEIGPVLRATDSAVVSELVGNDRMLSSLTYDDLRVHYDFRTGLYRVYDLAKDPGEQRDLMLYEPERALPHLAAMDRYREVRAGIRRATVLPEKSRAGRGDLRIRKKAKQGASSKARGKPKPTPGP